jgi:hypothetical protein
MCCSCGSTAASSGGGLSLVTTNRQVVSAPNPKPTTAPWRTWNPRDTITQCHPRRYIVGQDVDHDHCFVIRTQSPRFIAEFVEPDEADDGLILEDDEGFALASGDVAQPSSNIEPVPGRDLRRALPPLGDTRPDVFGARTHNRGAGAVVARRSAGAWIAHESERGPAEDRSPVQGLDRATS